MKVEAELSSERKRTREREENEVVRRYEGVCSTHMHLHGISYTAQEYTQHIQ